ncbi:MAG: tetratricopeptide repeat protein [Deltaproteobacteria bacterium]|nr:tetratricopeptide repeat protein [Deltaproteobacteria bacterium]
MLNKLNIGPGKQKLIIYVILTIIMFAVYWQVKQYDFISIDDPFYVTNNRHVQSGITLEEVRWAFSTTYAEFWFPLTWLSWMLDYQLYGLNAGGYHVTNLILHILSALLLFWFFCRMTGAVWKSAFVAALFALHPLHVESVVWIAERKDVLSAFFWMLTLCLYVYYTEKPVIKRYLLVLFSFVCALMSKSMVVTLPLILILLDYWPLKRFESKKDNLILWQLKEKFSFFILSAFFSVITLYTQYKPYGNSVKKYFPPLDSRITNAFVSLATYLEKTFWPHDLAAFFSSSGQIPVWQVLFSALLIIVISVAVILMAKRLPYLFVGWLWYLITVLPVLGIIPIVNGSDLSMSDRYTYLPSIGIGIMLAWGIPALIKSEEIKKYLLFPAVMIFLAVLSILTWRQCGYWKNGIELVNHTLQVTKNNYMAHIVRGQIYFDLGQYQQAIDDFNKVILLKRDFVTSYNNRGCAYAKLGQYQKAFEDFNEAIRLHQDFADAYNNRGCAYANTGQPRLAIEDFDKAIRLNKYFANAYNNRGSVYLNQGNTHMGCLDAEKACELGICIVLEASKGNGVCP